MMKKEQVHEVQNYHWCCHCNAPQKRVLKERITTKDGFVVGEKGYYKCQCGVTPFAFGKCTGDVQLLLNIGRGI